MNLKTIRPKNEAEDLLLSITESCETFIQETHKKEEQTLVFKMIKPRELFHFNPPTSIEGSWMLVLSSL